MINVKILFLVRRFFKFMMKEKTRKFFAFAFYVSFIAGLIEDLPWALEFICCIIREGSIIAYLWCWGKMPKRNRKRGKNIIQEVRKIAKEIVMFIPFLLISECVISFIMIGEPANQTKIEESFYEALIFNSIYVVIIGPIIEEFIFRFLPYSFIKNKKLYVIVSAVIFAAMHVINDSNPFYYIWFYILGALYYSYRYYKTKDIWVTISLHSFNNLIALFLFLF